MATPTDADDGATYAVASDKDSSIRNNVVDLAEGNNVITVTVTAADRVTTSTVTTSYVVTVDRVASNLSTNTTLHVLTLTYDHDGEPSTAARVQSVPGFASGGAPASNGYTAQVAHTVESVIVTATASRTNATVAGQSGVDEDSATGVTDANDDANKRSCC